MEKKRIGGDVSRRSFLKAIGAAGGGFAIHYTTQAAIAQRKPIVVGQCVDFTGPYGTEAKSQFHSVQLLFSEYKTLAGRPIKHVTRDTMLNPVEAARRAKELIEKEGADWLTGGISGPISLAINELAKHYKKIYIAPCQSNEITQAILLGKEGPFHKYMFHEAITPHMAAQGVGRWAFRRLGKRVAFLTADSLWANAIRDSFGELAEETGITNLGSIPFPLGTRYYSGYFAKVGALKPDILVVINFGKDQVYSTRQFESLGLKRKMKLVIPVTETTIAREAGPKAFHGVYCGSHFYWEQEKDFASAKKYVRAFTAKYGYPPTGYAAYIYSGNKEVCEAIQRVGKFDPDAIVSELEGHVYDCNRGPQYWRKCDHQSVQDIYVIRGKDPKKIKNPPWEQFEVVGRTQGGEKIMRSCARLGHKA
ncbi:MAG: ABC transporter substrate-binding protein [Nitrospinota bacterium]